MTTKKYLLDKIVENTERLKELKYTLEDLKGPPEDTFVTLWFILLKWEMENYMIKGL